MAHKTLVGGTAYEITGGKTLVGGTAYSIKKGRTLVGGTGYDINFAKGMVISYTGSHTIYGDMTKGWIEMRSNGTLTIDSDMPCDIYLIGGGLKGDSGDSYGSSTTTGGAGGDGGKYIEYFEKNLKGEHAVSIGKGTSYYHTATSATTISDLYTSNNGVSYASGGTGALISNNRPTSATAAGNGRQPFTGNNPMSSGFAAQKLGAGGGGGGAYYLPTYGTQHSIPPSSGGTYGGGSGSSSPNSNGDGGSSNTGSGGGGGCDYMEKGTYDWSNGGNGGTGIAIVRWGY